MKTLVLLLSLLAGSTAFSQALLIHNNRIWQTHYRATAEKNWDLVHTKLDVQFDFNKTRLYGKAWIKLTPHFYKSDSIILDAKGMELGTVAFINKGKIEPLSYTYADSMKLHIKLKRAIAATENIVLYIKYTAKPNEYKAKGSAAITDTKGLYFINPTGKIANKPTQIWTQGETHASSVWFPTIDEVNQKMTQEISMTVPATYVTLSNGLLTSKRLNKDGTRTDVWQMKLPHAPYLVFMGVGDFSIIKDKYKGKEVSYYVEKQFAAVARKIFGLTPEMMAFFSAKLGIEYPWAKYAQICGRDYVSGAMENTSATLHSDFLQQNARQLTDGNKYEEYISHELFHQWFGDLVTAESWSNLTLNESMATYGEVLWAEHKYGKDAGDAQNYNQMLGYLQSNQDDLHLVRFYYEDHEDMFDKVSYDKGGRILNMLRNYVGDAAFFKSLNLYLTLHKFKNAEAHELRLAFEQVSGKDLNWFFNQWFFGSGHPKLKIDYGYDEQTKKAMVAVEQLQDKNFTMPAAIDLYIGTAKKRFVVTVKNKVDTFYFKADVKPDLINFDGDKVLLAEKTENKSIYDYIHQYNVAKTYVDRREAIAYAITRRNMDEGRQLLKMALNDKYPPLVEMVLSNLKNVALDTNFIARIEQIAYSKKHRLLQAAAIDVLAQQQNKKYIPLYTSAAMDSSYSVSGAALQALTMVDLPAAEALVPKLEHDTKGRLKLAIQQVKSLSKTEADFSDITAAFDSMPLNEKFGEYKNYIMYLSKINDLDKFKTGIDKVIEFRTFGAGFSASFTQIINEQLLHLRKQKINARSTQNASNIDVQLAYIDLKIK